MGAAITTKFEIIMNREKECKGSVRFKAEDPGTGQKAIIESVYVNRANVDPKRTAIKITLEDPATSPTVPGKIEIIMNREKECKGSVRFKAEDPGNGQKAIIESVYVNRAGLGVNQVSVKLTLESAD